MLRGGRTFSWKNFAALTFMRAKGLTKITFLMPNFNCKFRFYFTYEKICTAFHFRIFVYLV